MFKLRHIAHNIFVRPLCRTNFFGSGPTFGGSRSWLHNIKCHTTHVAHTVHTTTTRFMSHNHVVPNCTTKFLSVWTHLYSLVEVCGRPDCRRYRQFFFSDEAWFSLIGCIKSQNYLWWSSKNPFGIIEMPLHAQKISL